MIILSSPLWMVTVSLLTIIALVPSKEFSIYSVAKIQNTFCGALVKRPLKPFLVRHRNRCSVSEFEG